eukprot:CAMPEP_0114611516 /NCGR_PEP_ID=MMETSP0168-20121206/4156_1 /TAXON_ID=95228 ORGANISM="Vannella sp., Strain DIVA3 517/6/12" /NCGR_SAMPLE_ID=MMETSP0168 /ASSEMBLY_ACC=CAM_ASM_000044 /LENGTH=143 /DNA_ID=CAMNT_0001822491 /DNA_START=40 /DNA_END=471 /DNA_ORIENTATION=-
MATRKRSAFKKFTYRGIDLDALLDMSNSEFAAIITSRQRRRLTRRGLARRHGALTTKLRNAKRDVVQGEKPPVVKTHLRNMIILPEMVGSVVGIYNGKEFNAVEIKPEMIGMYLGEFSISYRPVAHGRPGIGATNSSRFIPLK